MLIEFETYMQTFLSELLLGLFFRVVREASRCFHRIQNVRQEEAAMVYFILIWLAARVHFPNLKMCKANGIEPNPRNEQKNCHYHTPKSEQ